MPTHLHLGRISDLRLRDLGVSVCSGIEHHGLRARQQKLTWRPEVQGRGVRRAVPSEAGREQLLQACPRLVAGDTSQCLPSLCIWVQVSPSCKDTATLDQGHSSDLILT